MGLFSKLFKNKQESSGEDSGFYVPGEAQAPGRKRAANTSGGGGSRRAGREAADPALPEKKRARRRLIGAIALALGVAVGLPMLLDSEPKAPVNDIGIEIPSKDKAAAASPAPAPAAAAPASVPPAASNDGLDQSEEIVDAPLPPKTRPAAAAAPVVAAAEPAPARPFAETRSVAEVKPESRPERKPEPEPKHEAKPVKTEPKPEPKPKHEAKPEPKPEPKPAKPADDAARALAILEGKPVAKPAAEKAPEKAADSDGKFVVQVAALATQEKVDELQAKLRDAGIRSYTQKVSSAGGERIRVRVGPFGSREEAEKTRAKLQKLGLGGSLVPA